MIKGKNFVKVLVVSVLFFFVLSVVEAGEFPMVITEISPLSSPEWVEMKNVSGSDQDLAGWKLADEISDGGLNFTDLSGIISAGGYLVHWYSTTTPKLNNPGDVVYLIDPAGATTTAVSYGNKDEAGIVSNHLAEIPTDIQSIAYIGGTWQITSAKTPGADNRLPDTVAPTVDLTAPTGGTTKGLITISAHATDDSGGTGVASVSFFASSTLLNTLTLAPYSFEWNSSGVNDGVYDFYAVATDNSGNVATSSPISTTVNNYVQASVVSVTSTSTDGVYRKGQVIPIAVVFSKPVTVSLYSDEGPKLSIAVGSAVKQLDFSNGSGTDTLIFNYVVDSADIADKIDIASSSALVFNILDNSQVTIVDVIGNPAVIDLPVPGETNSLGARKSISVNGLLRGHITGVNTSVADGHYKAEREIFVSVAFNEPVTVSPYGGELPKLILRLNSGDKEISYEDGSGTDTLRFKYTVLSGDKSSRLDYASTTALLNNSADNSEATIFDLYGNAENLTLPEPGTAGSLGANKHIVIDTVPPVVTVLGNGNVVLEFGTEFVDEGATSTDDVDGDLTAFIASSTDFNFDTEEAGVTYRFDYAVTDRAGNSATSTRLIDVVDSQRPYVTGIEVATTTTFFRKGQTVPIRVHFSEKVKVEPYMYPVGSEMAFADPVIILNASSTARAFYKSGSDSKVLLFEYVVGDGDMANPLDIASADGLKFNTVDETVVTIRDLNSNRAELPLPIPGSADSLALKTPVVVDGLYRGSVVSVSSLSTEKTYRTGETVAISVLFNETVTVVGLPKILLNASTTPRYADYFSGSGGRTLTFHYTAVEGDIVSRLNYASTSSLVYAISGDTSVPTILDAVGNGAQVTLPNTDSHLSLAGSKNIAVDTYPQALLTGLPNNPTEDRITNIYVSGPSVASYIYSFDGHEWSGNQSTTTAIELSALPLGFHRISVRGATAGGLSQLDTANFQWVISGGNTASSTVTVVSPSERVFIEPETNSATSTIVTGLSATSTELDFGTNSYFGVTETTVTVPRPIVVESVTTFGTTTLSIPAGVVISGEGGEDGWNGLLSLPTITEVPSITADSGKTVDYAGAVGIALGFKNGQLTFDRAVRILFPGKADSYVSYSHNGGPLTKITNACVADTQIAGDALAPAGDCAMNSGFDLVIWTKHFSTFVVYNQTTTTTSGGGSTNSASNGPIWAWGQLPKASSVPVSVSATSTSTASSTGLITAEAFSQGQVLGESTFFFLNDMWYGINNNDVMELQKRLVAENFLTVNPTGYFGSSTKAAVLAYQERNGIRMTGYVGSITRSVLNGDGGGTISREIMIRILTEKIARLKAELSLLQ
jgi:hypothetical protein